MKRLVGIFILCAGCVFGQQQSSGNAVTVTGSGNAAAVSAAGALSVAPTNNLTPGTTTAPAQVAVAAGKSADSTPQYIAIPLGPSGLAVVTAPLGGPGLPLTRCNAVRLYYCK